MTEHVADLDALAAARGWEALARATNRSLDKAEARVTSLEKWLVQEREARWRLALELKRAQDMLAELLARVD